MGFGNLVHLKVFEIASKLAYWVLDKFDPKTCEMELNTKKRLHIDAEDVRLVFGLPKGKIPIKKKSKHEDCPVLKEWRTHFDRPSNKIRPCDVVEVMLLQTDGGSWFKRHFVILMTTCLIQTSTTGYIAPQIMGNLHDTSVVRKLNWCQYVLDTLVKQKIAWAKNQRNSFCGPIIFLLTTYVDRVELYSRAVRRTFPIIKGWTHPLMRLREKTEIDEGGFGQGFLRDRFDPSGATREKVAIPHKGASTSNSGIDEIHDYNNKLMAASKNLAESMMDIFTRL